MDARSGDMIRVTGTLSGDFVVANAGTKAAPLCGDAVLAGLSLEHGYTLHITADWWLISGLTVVACDNDVRDAGKGVSNIRCRP